MNASIASRSPRRIPVALLVILVLAAVIRGWVIDRDALWLDEGYSWWDAGQHLSALWKLVPTCDPHPPLYFALLHPWIALFGDGTVTMRLLSTLFGLATVAIVYLSGRQLDVARGHGDDRVGIGAIAALLFAITPFQVYFSVEARPYALLCFGASLLTLGCLIAVRSTKEIERRLAFAWLDRVDRSGMACLLIGGVIVVWTNNTAMLVLGAASAGFLALWFFDRESRSVIVPIVAVGALIGLLWAPDLPLLITQAKEVTGDFWIQKPSFEGITFELHNLIGLDVLRLTWWVAFAIFGGLLLIARKIGWRWALMVAAMALLPIVFNIVVSYLVSPILISRALIGAAPALALALASSVMLLRSRALRAAGVIALLIVHGMAVGRYLSADHVKEPWKPVVARISAEAQQAPVFVVPNELVLPLAHEAKMQHLDVHVHGLPADYPATDMTARYPSGKCAPSVIDQDLSPLMRSLHAEPVVVLLTRLNNTYDPKEAVAAALRAEGYTLQADDVFQPGDLRIMRFVRPKS
jgi:mannosyltransferase